MAPFKPFLFNYTTGRSLYGSSLEDPSQTEWSSHEQLPRVSNSQAFSGLAKFSIGASALLASGFINRRGGGNVWDLYYRGLRGLEEYSPGGMLRTLSLSTLASPFTSTTRNASLFVSPEQLTGNKLYTEILAKEIGEGRGGNTFQRLITEGVSLRQGTLYWGQGKDVALARASAYLSTGHGAAQRIGAARARMLGVSNRGLQHFLASIEPTPGVFNPQLGGEAAQIIGGKNLLQSTYRLLGAQGTELVERFNRLLNFPIENQPLKSIFGGIQETLKSNFGVRLSFGVEKTGGLRMLGKLSAKYGIALGGTVLGYQTADWLVRNSESLDNTVFSEGLTVGLATMGVKGWTGLSRLAEATGLHSYREKQEEIAPGSTSLQKLIAFPMMGAMSTGFLSYAYKVGQMAKLQRQQGLTAPAARELVEESFHKWESTPLLEGLGKLVSNREGLYARSDWIGKVIRKFSSLDETGTVVYKGLGKMTPVKLAASVGAMLGIGAILPFLPGALVPEKRPDELRKIYSGEQEVPVRKGRWWSLGRSPYEGTKIIYYRPHWYARMRQRSREIGIWGEDEDKMSPLSKLFKREFTYELERKHYEDRPYPVTGLPFEDVPLIGPLLANTIGRIIKPRQLMHTDEWKRGESALTESPSFGTRVATEMGELPEGVPVSPSDPSQVFGEQMYRLQEMVGLPGFLFGTFKQQITGREEFFDQLKQLESSRRMYGTERELWDLEMGDVLGANEAFRRLYPHRRRQIEQYNPIRNQMTSWLPGPGDRSPDFLHGDPWAAVPEGEMRLPGPGYAARFPELEGVAPEDYPLIHRFRILADIAQYSEKFDEVAREVRSVRNRKSWTTEDEAIWQTTVEQLKQRKGEKQFREYQYLSPTGDVSSPGADESSSLLAFINRQKANQEEKPSLFRKAFGGYWELLSHNAETPFDQLTPFSPASKFVHERTALESYERESIYGTQAAFWQHPVKNFLRPFAQLAAHSLGWDGVPSNVTHQRNLESYFDTLKYVKYSRLATAAHIAKDQEAIREFEKQKDQTIFGINPFTRNYENLLYALPRKERDYFLAFEKAGTLEERQRILELVPENEKALYLARWKLTNADQLRKAVKAEILSGDQVEEAEKEIQTVWDEASTEGLPSSKELMAMFWETRNEGENYADWYRRTQLLGDFQNLPGPNFVGWHPSVDLEDIKLKVIDTLGEDLHDYNLWPSRARLLPYKPYLDEEAIGPIVNPEQLSEDEIRSRIDELMSDRGVRASVFISRTNSPGLASSTDISIDQGREEETKNLLSRII